jgi:hypothetical protein
MHFSTLNILAVSSFFWVGSLCFGERLNLTSIDKILDATKMMSRDGRKIEVFEDNSNDVKAWPLIINGTTHGNEKLSREFVLWLKERFQHKVGLLSQIGLPIKIDFLPTLNPDGYARDRRENSNQVNLNRNFSVLWGFSRENPGVTAFSEPETKSLRGLFLKKQYKMAIDVHGYTNWVVIPSPPRLVYKTQSTSVMKSLWSGWVKKMESTVSTLLPEYDLKTAGSLGDGGAFEDWAFWDARAWSACVELQGPNKPLSDMSPEELKTTMKSFERYELFLSQVIKNAFELDQEKVNLSSL